jgi:hypothetical protein
VKRDLSDFRLIFETIECKIPDGVISDFRETNRFIAPSLGFAEGDERKKQN